MIRFLPNSIEKIRKDYSSEILYAAIRTSFPRAITGKYALSPEQTFVEVIQLLDELKELQTVIEWNDLYGRLQDDCNRSCSDISEYELHAVVSIIIVALAAVLLYSPYRFYLNTGKSLIKQYNVQNTYNEQRQKIDRMVEAMDKAHVEIRTWLISYMQSAEFLSSALKPYYEQEPVKTFAHRFKYLKEEVDRDSVYQLETALHEAAEKKYPAKEMVVVLKKNVSILNIMGVAINEVYNELHAYYNLNQTYVTFSSHYPSQWWRG